MIIINYHPRHTLDRWADERHMSNTYRCGPMYYQYSKTKLYFSFTLDKLIINYWEKRNLFRVGNRIKNCVFSVKL